MLNGALVIEMVNNYFTESKKNYVLIEKNEILVVQNISPLNFAKYLTYSEVQKNRNIVNNWNRFSKVGVYSKSVTKLLYGKFLVSEGIFNLVCCCEKCRLSDISRA